MKLNGYRPSHRNKWMFLREGVLTIQEFLLYEYILDQFDFDTSHEKFGTFELYLDDVAPVFDKQPGSVRSWLNGLLAKGFVEKTNRKYLFRLVCPLKHIGPGSKGGQAAQFAKFEKDQSVEQIFQNMGIKFQPIEKKVQRIEQNEGSYLKEDAPRALGSFKVDSRFSYSNVNEAEDKDSEEIHNSGGYHLLLPEDMEWLDNNF
jgi:hypothetical protein